MKSSILAEIMALDLSTAVKYSNLTPINETDEVLGVLSDDLKRVWFFLETLSQKAKEASGPLIEELRELSRKHEEAHEGQNHSEKDCGEFQKNGTELQDKINKIVFSHRQAKTLFWAAVQLEFELTEELPLAIREGSVLVKTPPTEDGFASLLGRLTINLVPVPA